MKRNWFAAAGVALIVVAIVTYKRWNQVQTPVSEQAKSAGISGTGRSILLIADPREANESDGCGEIIRMVRAAGARGIPLREVAPGRAPGLTSRYQVVVSPSVLVLENGDVLKRYEGESPETVESIRTELHAIEEHR
jgi:hypothetical protein